MSSSSFVPPERPLGDGLFETLRVFEGKPLLALYHWERLVAGAAVLGLQALSWAVFEAALKRALLDSRAGGSLRLRLVLWRQGAGAYLPGEGARTECFVQTAPLPASPLPYPLPSVPLRLTICPDVLCCPDALSPYKTLSALRYVYAARYAAGQGADDALLLNPWGRVAEATASNVFWWEGEQLCTVPLSEGCVGGVMRRWVLEQALLMGFPVQEKSAALDDLRLADELWLTNAVQGIRPATLHSGQKAVERARAFTLHLNRHTNPLLPE